MRRWASSAAWATAWSRCTARAPPRSPTPGNARSRHEVHQGTLPLSAMEKYDRPVGIGPLITVDRTGPVDVAAVAAEVRRLHTS